jgi:anti-sigma factor ChrR (cupin superfamily)
MMCREVTELLTEAMEGALPTGQRRALAFHMALCPYCSRHKRQIETLIGTLRALEAPSPSDEAKKKARDAFRARKKKGV